MDNRKDVADLIVEGLHQAMPTIIERATSATKSPPFTAEQIAWLNEWWPQRKERHEQDSGFILTADLERGGLMLVNRQDGSVRWRQIEAGGS